MRLLDVIALLPGGSASFPSGQGWVFNTTPLGLDWGPAPIVAEGMEDEMSPPFIVDGVPNPMRCDRVRLARETPCLAVQPVTPVVMGAVAVISPPPPMGAVVLARRR